MIFFQTCIFTCQINSKTKQRFYFPNKYVAQASESCNYDLKTEYITGLVEKIFWFGMVWLVGWDLGYISLQLVNEHLI